MHRVKPGRDAVADSRLLNDPPRRAAMISVHTSPLDQPGTGDAGGLNVYIIELARRLAERDVAVDVFTRATSPDLPPVVEVVPGVLVRHVIAGPRAPLAKGDLSAQLGAFAAGLLTAEAAHAAGRYDVVHSHYWLSGKVGWLATEQWGVPLVHSMHTMAKVKNQALANGDSPEPLARQLGEQHIVDVADRLIANTDDETAQLVALYDAEPRKVVTVPPGVDLDVFSPGSQRASRAALGLPRDATVILFAGRLQPHKGPEVLIQAIASLVRKQPSLRDTLVVAVVGGPSGREDELAALAGLAQSLRLGDVVRFEAPATQGLLARWYRAATLTVVPSYSESFGLVALESQACGTPVVAANVGGLRCAVADGRSGVLVDGHNPDVWADELRALFADPRHLEAMRRSSLQHAAEYGWDATAERTLATYANARAEKAAAPLPCR